ncbi:MAG: ribonuclease HI [Acidimicrobiales bacterium]|nr:ribonuclease HI [Acidimicrobiales bacterium]RZV48044.1 MAG: ribonuclease HI [Acidimicrobiales bacterium]
MNKSTANRCHAGSVTTTEERTTVYTDGACAGNPGPGGWAWVVPDGAWSSGAEDPSTNQRMELQAVLHAVTHLYGPIHIVSDSTYVVNCFRDRWWQGWERRGWKNSQKKDVANQDLWKPLVAAYKEGDITFEWVKGHSGDTWNDVADQLAVDAGTGGGAHGRVQPAASRVGD